MRFALLGPALLAIALAPSTAHALTSSRVGAYVDALGGAAFVTPQPALGGGWEADAGLWFGKYDDEYSLGRFFGVGVGGRQQFTANGSHNTLEVELIRGEDVIVLGGHALVAAGVIWGTRPWVSCGPACDNIAESWVGETVDVGVLFKARVRFTGKYLGIAGRVDAGPDLVGSTLGAHAAVMFGFEFAAPFQKRAPSP